jgi:TRAP-type mannitol/chloroaromatic compound transport system substrate-binding protein
MDWAADDAALGLNTVWKNYYLQGLHQAIDIGDIYVNLDWWDKLPKTCRPCGPSWPDHRHLQLERARTARP